MFRGGLERLGLREVRYRVLPLFSVPIVRLGAMRLPAVRLSQSCRGSFLLLFDVRLSPIWSVVVSLCLDRFLRL